METTKGAARKSGSFYIALMTLLQRRLLKQHGLCDLCPAPGALWVKHLTPGTNEKARHR